MSKRPHKRARLGSVDALTLRTLQNMADTRRASSALGLDSPRSIMCATSSQATLAFPPPASIPPRHGSTGVNPGAGAGGGASSGGGAGSGVRNVAGAGGSVGSGAGAGGSAAATCRGDVASMCRGGGASIHRSGVGSAASSGGTCSLEQTAGIVSRSTTSEYGASWLASKKPVRVKDDAHGLRVQFANGEVYTVPRSVSVITAEEKLLAAHDADHVRVPFRIIRCDAEECCPGPKTRIIHARTVTTRTSELVFTKPPRNVLMVKKWKDPEVTKEMIAFVRKASAELKVKFWLKLDDDESFPEFPRFADVSMIDLMDLVVCFGGDGTVLHNASLFPGPIPPMLPIAMGSLGFMSPFTAESAMTVLKRIVTKHNIPSALSIRVRLKCQVYRRGATKPEVEITGLNELLIDRGRNVQMATLEAYVDGVHLTTVQADGIIVATPTGSTAYNLSAGGSMLLPTVPALCFTPICPHSLSFRPVLIPDCSTVTIVVPDDARTSPCASVDGRSQVALQRGDKVVVSVSNWPLAVIAKHSATQDWIDSIKRSLLWNVRERQKALANL